ncbi:MULTISPECIES: LacI family DNA-binding transcriptional regulator [Hymenobacter]|uniref:LacI family DNA-binding transcriptional regulator n=1 Tax=Hymenobacter armeniacus TaxID=2771358 RepID=A0ABR8JPX6_9BACT|nr:MULTISPECIES: LacI family DNA-binding transcriptional regulator [Hymenobacter]MBD2722046.1 LacI family DNA-binding transcriptional regulator [Hymenobacter armeniacus]MBJ6108041.1 LacI family DNA-binding transcriptional regulator [Hymenobacter sp. BT523]
MALKHASISDIAKELNLAVSTVSRALSGHSRISEATRARVWELAEQLNYQPNHLAAALRKGRSNTLGVIVPNIDGHFFALVVKGIEAVANQAGFNVMLCQSNEDYAHEAKNVETLINAQVDGILVSLARTTHDFKHFEKVRQRNMPLVFFDRILNGSEVSAVVVDDQAGGYLATRHLLQQGRRRIAHLGGPQHLNIYKDRYEGYCQALREAGLSVEEDLVVLSKDMSLADGAVSVRQLLALPERPDAIFSAGDFTAVGALQALKEHGLRVPHDVALGGFGNETFSSLTEPQLTTIDQQCEEMGGAAVRLLLEMVQQAGHRLAPRKIVLEPHLLMRESSGRRQHA